MKDLPVNSVAQSDLTALCLTDLKGPRRVVAVVSATNLEVIRSTLNVINGELEGQLRVAVDANVDEVGNGDGLGNGKACEKGGGGELHVDDWTGSESVEVGWNLIA
jgi:hypothetical protein